MKKVFSFLLFFVICSHGFSAQDYKNLTVDTVVKRMVDQLLLYPQEKIHVQVDRSAYLPGDTVWLKVYPVHAAFHTASNQSRYVYVELINPLDSLTNRIKLRPDKENMFYGYIPLSMDLPDGDYTLRAYTSYMMGESEDYFFTRSLKVLSPPWSRISLNTHSNRVEGSKMELSMTFTTNTYQPLFLAKARMELKQGKPRSLTINNNLSIVSTFNPKDIALNQSMFLDFTDNGGNKYKKYFPLSSDKIDYDVTFYPEGGYLLAGQKCRVAFKVLDRSGNAADVKMEIVDDKGNVWATGSTVYQGMGSFTFVPQQGQKYRARCVNRLSMTKIVDLPNIQSILHGIRVDSEEENIRVTLLSADRATEDSLYLIAHVRGGVVYADWWKSRTKSLLFNKKYFPSGVIQFLLLDKNMNPLSERLAFCFHGQAIHTTFQTDKQTYGIREEIKVDMLLSDYMQKPVEGNLSVSITDSKDVPADTCFNILTTLLLTSDLKGYIETPSFYFQKDNEEATQALDLLMLTQGWRRYDISEVIAGRMKKPEMKPETSFNISGRVKETFILSKRKEYVLSISGIGANFNDITEIGKDGHFSFEGIEYPDGVGFSLQAIRSKGGSNQKQSIQIDGETLPEITSYIPQVKMPEDTIVAVHSDEYIAPMKNGMRGYVLDAVEVKAIYWGSTDYDKFSNEEINDPSNKDVRKFIQDMGIKVVTRWGTDDAVPQEEFYYKGTEVIAFIDDKFYKFGYGRDIMYDLSLNDIEEIVFLKNVDRGMVDELLMERGYYDVHTARKQTPSYYIYNILENKSQLPVLDIKTKQNFDSRFLGIYFRDGKDAREWGSTQNRKTIYPLGYQRPVEFYAPKYDTPEKKNDKTEDLRTTIFWKPDIKTGQEGASFSFYASDTPTTYSVVIEGLSDKGDIIYDVKEIKVK